MLLVLIVVGSSACNLINRSEFPTDTDQSALITIDQVRAGDGPGQFSLSGTASLPPETRLTVSAVRSLATAAALDDNDDPTLYGILDRQTARIEAGRWQSTLSLWEPNADGLYQEPWQGKSGVLSEDIDPNSSVNFLLTVEPQEYARSIEPGIPSRLEEQINQVLHFTPSGEPYLRVSTVLPVALPDNSARAFTLDANQSPASPWDGRNALDDMSTAIERESQRPFLQEDNLPISENEMLR